MLTHKFDTCCITLTKSLRTVLLLVLFVMTAVVRYRRICGQVVCIAFKYLKINVKIKIN